MEKQNILSNDMTIFNKLIALNCIFLLKENSMNVHHMLRNNRSSNMFAIFLVLDRFQRS